MVYQYASGNGRSVMYYSCANSVQPLPQHRISLGPREMQLEPDRNSMFISHVFTKSAQLLSNKTGKVRINVTLGPTIMAVENNVLNILSVCLCRLRYPECNGLAPCYVTCGPSGLTMLFNIIH